jgi:hypothetical protein
MGNSTNNDWKNCGYPQYPAEKPVSAAEAVAKDASFYV